MAQRRLDIRRHRKRMIEEDLESKFKDAQDHLRIIVKHSSDVPSTY
jgi:hypothetical protein